MDVQRGEIIIIMFRKSIGCTSLIVTHLFKNAKTVETSRTGEFKEME